MEEQLRQEIATLCASISNAATDAPLSKLIHQLDALQEKLIVLDYLQVRESRFIENTQRLRQQMLAAVAATPLELPTASSIETSAPKEPVATPATPIAHEAPIQAEKPTPPPAPVAPPQQEFEPEPTPAPVVPLFDAFEPDTTPDETPPATPRKTLRTQDFVENPAPVITAKPTAKAWEPKQPEPAKAAPAPAQPATLGDKVAQTGKSSLNDRLNKKAINIGLNDRLAFVKHLFAGSQEDFNRVISQLNTQTSWQEAEGFIANFVKPDYDWAGKEDYETRFLELVRLKFEA
jgi:hypothetical protein